jgi:two-component system, NarL family, sensor histidine kinase UhpB
VWMIKPGESEAGSLKQRMERFAYEICGSKNIIATLQIDELEKLRLTMEQRKNLYLIFKEAMNNAVKYSGTEKIEVKAMMQQKQLEMMIQDYGQGFDVSKSTRGNGLGNMLQRAKDMQAQLQVESAAGKGTSIKLICSV